MAQLLQVFRDSLIVIVPVAAMLLFRPILRHSLRRQDQRESQEALPSLVRTMAVFFGIIAGLVLTAGSAKVAYLRETTAREINSLTVLGLVSSRLPAPVGPRAAREIEVYVSSLVNEELPSLAEGRLSLETGLALSRLWVTFLDMTPEDETQSSLRALALQQLDVISEQRQVRISGGARRTPRETWAVLIAGSLVILVGATLESLRYHRVATVFLAALTALVSLLLLGIYETDHPFRYGLSGEREFYDSFLAQYEYIRAGLLPASGRTAQ